MSNKLKEKNPEEIVYANSARVQEALRVIEEFSRGHNYNLSQTASKIRYEIYTLEIDLTNYYNLLKGTSIITKTIYIQ